MFLDAAEPDRHRIAAPLRISLRERERKREGERERKRERELVLYKAIVNHSA